MKIAIISDTHDNIANLKKAAEFIKKEKIKTIILCGDIFKSETIKEGLKRFAGKIYLVFSPVDADFSGIPRDSFKKIPHAKIFEKYGSVVINKKKIAFCHFPEIARELAVLQKYDLVFFGHTHKPWEEKIGKTRLVNPGNLAGIFYKATFAVYDASIGGLELKIIDADK